MRTYIIPLLLTGLLILSACDEKEDSPGPVITYPLTFNGKVNVLIDSAFVVQGGLVYSMAADLPKGTSIEIHCRPTNGSNWVGAGFVMTERLGFSYRDVNPNTIIFEAEGEGGIVNVPMMFGGSADVDPTSINFTIYENNAETPTRTKTVRTYELE